MPDPELGVADPVAADPVTEPVSWLDAHEGLSDDDRKLYESKNFPDAATALKAGADTYRMVGKALHLPDEKTSDEDRATFNEKIAEYQGVPKTAEEYKLEAKLPEGTEKDEVLDKGFRTVASEIKLPQSMAEKMYAWWNGLMSERHEAMETQAKEAEDVLRKEVGKEEFETMFGKPGDKEKIGQCKMALLHISREIKADYKDKDGNPQSHLIDDLELGRKNGAIGDKTWVGRAFVWAYRELLREGVTLTSAGTTQAEKAGKSAYDFEDMDEEKNEAFDYGG